MTLFLLTPNFKILLYISFQYVEEAINIGLFVFNKVSGFFISQFKNEFSFVLFSLSTKKATLDLLNKNDLLIISLA